MQGLGALYRRALIRRPQRLGDCSMDLSKARRKAV